MFEHVLEIIVTKLVEHGPWGFLVGFLLYTNWQLNKRLDIESESVDKMLVRHAEQREESATVLAGSAAAMIKVADGVKLLSDQIEGLSNKIDSTNNQTVVTAAALSGLQQTVLNDLANRRGRRV